VKKGQVKNKTKEGLQENNPKVKNDVTGGSIENCCFMPFLSRVLFCSLAVYIIHSTIL